MLYPLSYRGGAGRILPWRGPAPPVLAGAGTTRGTVLKPFLFGIFGYLRGYGALRRGVLYPLSYGGVRR
jgi:hypothetical protein